jgi:hypothetical protein
MVLMLDAKNLEIENRIKTITEGITGSNLIESEANAQKAVAEWNSAIVGIQSDDRKNECGSCTKTGRKYSRKDYQRLRKKRAEIKH